MKAIIPRTAAYLEVRSGCPPNERNMKYPTYIKNKISVVVSRGSQVHHVPQIGLAQIGPVINVPIIFYSVRFWEEQFQSHPQVEITQQIPDIVIPFLVSLIIFTMLFSFMLRFRMHVLKIIDSRNRL